MATDMSLAYPDYESIVDMYTEGIHRMYKLHEIHGDKDGGPIRAAKESSQKIWLMP